ncbi:Hypothetical protein SSCIU_01668 [Mammaliicoccus sciuri]|nr:Hypothetical protein SSCIU_01668 [Mammaliicoccus sciuri]
MSTVGFFVRLLADLDGSANTGVVISRLG